MTHTAPLDILQIVTISLVLALSVLTVELKNLMYALLAFCGMSIGIGAFYWLLNAPYVAVFQVLIYAGAVVTIFLAALMLTKMKEVVK